MLIFFYYDYINFILVLSILIFQKKYENFNSKIFRFHKPILIMRSTNLGLECKRQKKNKKNKKKITDPKLKLLKLIPS